MAFLLFTGVYFQQPTLDLKLNESSLPGKFQATSFTLGSFIILFSVDHLGLHVYQYLKLFNTLSLVLYTWFSSLNLISDRIMQTSKQAPLSYSGICYHISYFSGAVIFKLNVRIFWKLYKCTETKQRYVDMQAVDNCVFLRSFSGTFVARVQAVAEMGSSDQITYSLTKDKGWFEINSTSGVITVAKTLDREVRRK